MAVRPRSALVLLAFALGACGGGGGSGSNVLALQPDSDGDGLPDALEHELGSDASDPGSPFENGARDLDTPDGPGPDALPDGLERYLLGRGARAPVIATSDTDRDGVPDYLEIRSGFDFLDPEQPLPQGGIDLDGPSGPAFDGISDALESFLLRRGARAPLTAANDSDADGLEDVLEARSGTDPFDALDPPYGRLFDLDRDGVPDALELALGSDLLNADFPVFDGADDDEGGVLGPDGDGIPDGLEGLLVRFGAEAPLTTVSDSDGDGVGDQAEVRAGRDPFDADDPLAGGGADRDGDLLSDALEALLEQKGAPRDPGRTSDSDRDRIPDFAELRSGSNPFDPADPRLFGHFDLDGDGVPDFLEAARGSGALDPDDPLSSGGLDVIDGTGPPSDPISDALELVLVQLGASAPVTTYTDSDQDGVPDFVEVRLVSDPFDADSPLFAGALDLDDASGPPGDGISDAVEHVLLALGAAAPVDASSRSDGDVIPDVIELRTGTNPLESRSPRPNQQADVDADGAPDYLELLSGSDPLSADDPLPGGAGDQDKDGLSDALEELLRVSGTPVPVSPTSDSDGDGLYDYLEIALASGRHDPDHPIRNGGADTDERSGPAGDGISDALEFYLIESGARRPVSTRSDSDGDRVPDYLELVLALDAFDATSPLADGGSDSDGDGVSNALEFVLERLGALPPVDARTDSDLDGVPDAFEAASGTNPIDPDHPLASGGLDLIDATGPRDTISDGLESLLISQGALPPVTHASDSDLDGAPDHLEVPAGSLPFDAESPVPDGASDDDADHMSSALEAVLVSLGAAAPVGLRSDTDRDGAPDYFEVEAAAHPVNASDPVPDGAASGFDSDASTGLNGDGISDALELLLVRIGVTPPIRTFSDFDTDGLPDYFEVRIGSNPLDGSSPAPNGGADSDDAGGPAGDGISDALEQALIAGGASGPVTLATDTDEDGVPDFYEVFKGSDPFDPTSTIAPGTPPSAEDVAISGIAFAGRTLTGSYRYADDEDDPEGTTSFRWLIAGNPIPGETSIAHVVQPDEAGEFLDFEVTPVSLLAYPPETSIGAAVTATRFVPEPDFPRGGGGPGGVGVADGNSELRLWLRSDRGVTTNVLDFVLAWADQSGWKRDAAPSGPSKEPDYVSDVGPRLARAVRFDGTSALAFDRPVEDDFSLIAAFVTSSSAGNGAWYLSPALFGGETPPPCGADFHLGVNFSKALFVVADTQVTGVNNVANGIPHMLLATRAQASGKMRISLDGTTQGNGTASTASLTCPTVLFLGSSTFLDGFWTGDVFEVIAYSKVLGLTERTLINNYLAGRAGTNVSEARYAFLDTHGGDIAGIGRENDADLLSSAEGPGLLQVSAPTALSDGDYLMWGTDLPEDFSLSDDVPAPFTHRLKRAWRTTLTDGGAGDGVGSVSVRFRVGGLFLSTDARDFALLLDEDGFFADARVFTTGASYDPVFDTISFFGVDLSQTSYLTLAVKPL